MASVQQEKRVENVVKMVVGGSVGFFLFWLTSHPTRSPLRRRLPNKKVKNVELLPEIRISRKNTSYHFHHWLNIGSIYLFLYWKKRGWWRNKFFNGLMLGGILQGLSYRDAFTFRTRHKSALAKIRPELEPVNE